VGTNRLPKTTLRMNHGHSVLTVQRAHVLRSGARLSAPISRTHCRLPTKGQPGVGTCWRSIIEALNGALSARGFDVVLTVLVNP
jgi:hypothetical protein